MEKLSTLIILVLFIHFVSDFVLQTSQMAQNKSKSWKWLSIHIAVYTVPFFIFGWKYALINGAIHFVVDAVSSRASGHFYAKQDIPNFWKVIGFDQFVHAATLIATIGLIQ